MSTTPSPRNHVAALDGLRAFAVASVIVFHGRPDDLAASATFGERLFYQISSAGWVGVDLFFVLSGFLITGILLEAKGKPHFFRNFYIRRTLRIFPLYYAVLIVMLVVLPHVLDARDPGIQKALAHQTSLWTYTSNLAVFANNGWLFNVGWMHLTHLWSLAIEEQFYLLWPLFVFVLPKRWLAPTAVAAIIAAPILRGVMLEDAFSPKVVYSFTACRVDALAVGSLLAVLAKARPHWVPLLAKWLTIGGAIGLAIIIVVDHGLPAYGPLVEILGFSLLAALFGGVVLSATMPLPTTRALAWKPLVVIGKYTYGIYLFHALLVPFVIDRIGIDRVASIVHSRAFAEILLDILLFAVSLGVAVVSFHVFEQHFLKLKDRFAR